MDDQILIAADYRPYAEEAYWWNGLFQKYVTHGYYPSRETFSGKLNCCRKHLEHFKKYSPSPRIDFKALELGTGAWPVVPIGLYLCDASQIWTYDLVPVLRKDTLKKTLQLFCDFQSKGELAKLLPDLVQNKCDNLEKLVGIADEKAPSEILKTLNIKVVVGDAGSSRLQDNSIDLIFSTVVFEHIDREILKSLLEEFARVGSPDCVMSHHIGLADQYASFDNSITPFNFLKYDSAKWRLFNNPVIPQSRLRMADYRELFAETGWRIVNEENKAGSLSDLNKVELAAEFQPHSTEDLLILFSWIVSRPG